MRSTIRYAVAALFSAGAVSLALAQAPQDPQDQRFVSEPVASPLGDSERSAAIAQALNADPALRNSKITVQADGDNVLLTGASITQDQAQLATEIANAQAGNAKVVNVIQPDRIKYKSLAQLMPEEGETPQAGGEASGRGEQAAQAEEEEVEPVVNQFGQPQKS